MSELHAEPHSNKTQTALGKLRAWTRGDRLSLGSVIIACSSLSFVIYDHKSDPFVSTIAIGVGLVGFGFSLSSLVNRIRALKRENQTLREGPDRASKFFAEANQEREARFKLERELECERAKRTEFLQHALRRESAKRVSDDEVSTLRESLKKTESDIAHIRAELLRTTEENQQLRDRYVAARREAKSDAQTFANSEAKVEEICNKMASLQQEYQTLHGQMSVKDYQTKQRIEELESAVQKARLEAAESCNTAAATYAAERATLLAALDELRRPATAAEVIIGTLIVNSSGGMNSINIGVDRNSLREAAEVRSLKGSKTLTLKKVARG